jgi:hypothetical protein
VGIELITKRLQWRCRGLLQWLWNCTIEIKSSTKSKMIMKSIPFQENNRVTTIVTIPEISGNDSHRDQKGRVKSNWKLTKMGA